MGIDKYRRHRITAYGIFMFSKLLVCGGALNLCVNIKNLFILIHLFEDEIHKEEILTFVGFYHRFFQY